MIKIYPQAYLSDKLVPVEQANLSIASSAVLYGLSVYTVFYVTPAAEKFRAFRLKDHYDRLVNSAKIIGINTFGMSYQEFVAVIKEVISANDIDRDVFVRVSIHVDALVPGTRSRDLNSAISVFIYDAVPIVPLAGARLKTSPWRRIPDNAIPSRAKVNGAYVNSVLARQDAIDSGYDDSIFLDSQGHVCELSASNIFIVRDGHIITPDTNSDLLEGISRRSIVQIGKDEGFDVVERMVDLTELYIADEVFITGTSAFLTPVIDVDSRRVGSGKTGEITKRLQSIYTVALNGENKKYSQWSTIL